MNGRDRAAPLPLNDGTSRRRLVTAVAATVCAGALTLATATTSAGLFLVLSNASPVQARPTSAWQYWVLYRHDPKLRRRLLGSVAVSALAWIAAPAALCGAARPRPLHGDARFATAREVARAGLLAPSRHGAATVGPTILVGRYRGRYLALPGQLSVLLSAPTRSGKGVGVVIPNLLAWPDSVVVLDVKGENYELTAGYRAEHGQAVYAFSPFDPQARSHRWNPLSAVRTSARYRVADLLAIGQVLFPNDGSGTSSEAFFNDQARNLFLGLGLMLLETPALPRTIGELLRQSAGRGRPLQVHLAATIARRQADATPAQPALSDECVDALQRLLSNSDNTLASIVATLNAPLTVFADTVVDAATSGDDFRLQDVRRQRMSIYVRIPPNRLATARPLLNLFFSQLVGLNTEQLPSQDPSLTLQCLLVNDEFAVMGRVRAITDAAAFLSGYGVRLLTVVQALSQLDALYGAKESRTFATNHGLQILFAPREQRDAEEYSAMLGQYTQRATSFGRSRSHGLNGHGACSRHDSDQRRALLLPQEFKELGPERLVVILEHCKPILAQKIRYHRDPVFTSRLRPAPLVPPLDIDRHLARVQLSARGASDDAPAGQGIENAVRTCRTCGPAQLSQGLPPQVWPDQASNTLQGFFPGAGPDLDGARREDPGRAHSPSASPETSDAALTRSVASS